MKFEDLPDDALILETKVYRNRRGGEYGLVEVSRSKWKEGVKAGRYPPPIRIDLRSLLW